MENKNFEITDYSELESVSTKIKDTVNSSTDHVATLEMNFKELFETNIFSGPIADDCKEKASLILKAIETNIQKLNEASKVLDDITKAYKQTDTTTSSNISGV